jgi:hypothetical protein
MAPSLLVLALDGGDLQLLVALHKVRRVRHCWTTDEEEASHGKFDLRHAQEWNVTVATDEGNFAQYQGKGTKAPCIVFPVRLHKV